MQEYFAESKVPFHIYNRGTEKRIIFTDYAEYCRFVFLMWVCRIGKLKINLSKSETIQAAESLLGGEEPDSSLYIKEFDPLVAFITWNLMPNHYHFMLVSLAERGITKYMSKIGDAFTKYFNARHERSGRLFQGPCQSIEVKSSKYFYILVRYINMNHAELVEPQWKERRIRDRYKMREFVDSYQWSAHQDFMGKRNSLLINRELISELFGAEFTDKGLKGYQDFIEAWFDDDFETKEIKEYILEKR